MGFGFSVIFGEPQTMQTAIPRVLDGLNTALSRYPLVALLAGALLGGLVSGILELFFPRIVNRLMHRVRRGIVLDPLDVLMKGQASLHVVVGNVPTVDFRRLGPGDPIILPPNAPFLPFGMAMGMADLRAAVSRRFGSSRSLEFHDPDHCGESIKHSFIALGGPYIHPIVKSVLDQGLVPEFAIQDGPIASDQADVYSSSREGVQSDGPLASDIGVLIWVRSPYNESCKLCILFGLWPQGTLAAVDALINKVGPRSKCSEFRRHIRRGDDCIAIVRSNISGLIVGTPTILKVRAL
jgi:hypothetical protein